MKNNLIKQLKIKNIVPFYITDVNDKFFTSLKNHPSKTFVNKVLPKIQKHLEEDELQKFYEIDNLTKIEKIKLMLNMALKKIAYKTGATDADFFAIQEKDKFNQPLYIREISNYGDIQLVGNQYDDRRYNFSIEINEDSYMNQYVEEIQLSFNLDSDNKILSGGFSINSKQINKETISFEETINQIYLNSLIRHFITKQLYPMTLDNILDIVQLYEKTSKKKTQKTITKQINRQNLSFKNVNVTDLQQNWIDFINRKYLNFKETNETQRHYYENDLFFSMLIICIINLSMYEELKRYFTNENPEIILSILEEPTEIKSNESQTPDIDFIEISKYLRTTYFNEQSSKKAKLKNIKTAQDFFDTINEHAYYENYSIGKQVLSCEIMREDNEPFISEVDLFNKDEELKLIYMLIIHPELFGLDENTGNFIEYKQLLNVLLKNTLSKKLSESLKIKVEDSTCEVNYNYITFLSDNYSIFLVKNDTYLFENNTKINKRSNLFANYFWATIYAQSRNWMRLDIEYEFNNPNIEKTKNYYRHKLKILENLKFSWYDAFYGMPQIKGIVLKINELNKIQDSIESLIEKMRSTDQLNKKDQERKNIVLAYIAASIIGFINFFGMVFTILTVTDVEKGLTPINLSVISVGSILAFILLIILVTFFIRILVSKSKTKKEK